MLNTAMDLKVNIDVDANQMTIHYDPKTERTLYDLCDMNGRVLRTGLISCKETILEMAGLTAKKYVMLIVDGDRVISQRISLAA